MLIIQIFQDCMDMFVKIYNGDLIGLQQGLGKL